jgi:hypothetical protein
MPCTAPYSRGSRALLGFRKKAGNSLVEIITGLFIIVFMFIPVFSFVNTFSNGNTVIQQASFVTKIKMDIALSCSEAMRCLRGQKIVYDKGDIFFGFKFSDKLKIKINHYGQIEMGDSVAVEKNGIRYIVKIKPVTGAVSIEIV